MQLYQLMEVLPTIFPMQTGMVSTPLLILQMMELATAILPR